MRRGGSYLLFYAGGHCCRPPCTYAEGVARSSSLLGPYVKDPANPLLAGNAAWQCPGHGTTIDLGAGGLYLLHHAYRSDDAFDRRRSALLDRVDFTPDGWPTIAGGLGPALTAAAPLGSAGAAAPPGFTDRFDAAALAPGWEWPFFAAPDARPDRGALRLTCRGARRPSFLARQVPVDRFTALATVAAPRRHGAGIGVAAQGPGRVLRGIELRDGRVRAFRSDDRGLRLGPTRPAPPGDRLRLVLNATPDGAVALYVGARPRRAVAHRGRPRREGAAGHPHRAHLPRDGGDPGRRGSTHGIDSDCTDCHVAGPNIVDQLEGAHLTWKAYMEDLPKPCSRCCGRRRLRQEARPLHVLRRRRAATRDAAATWCGFGRLVADLRRGDVARLRLHLAQPLP